MENEFVQRLHAMLPAHPLLRLGIGDDAAILSLGEGVDCVLSVDVITDRVDFILGEVDARRIGRKALAVNLSDLAAMAARPIAAVVGLVLPRQGAFDTAVALYEGMLPLAEAFDIAIAGGDTNTWDGPLAISVTVLGRVTERGPLLRGGANVGDRILVTGALGGSILGRHFDFMPRVREALTLAASYDLHAGMDISDGLLLDLSRMARASGVGVEVFLPSIPIAEDAFRLSEQRADGVTPLEHAASDGEDFELLLAVSPDEAERLMAEQPLETPLTDIGRFIGGSELRGLDHSGRLIRLNPAGFEHRME